MAKQEVAYGQMSHLSKEGDFTSKPPQRPTPNLGFVPFHQQQGLPESRQPQPSLALSLERPDTYSDVNIQHYQYPHEGPFRPAPARPFEVHQPDVQPYNVRSDGVSSFDLEKQPFQHMEHPTHYTPSFEETHHDTEMENTVPAFNSGASAEQVDDETQLQNVSASEYPSNDQSAHLQYYPLASANHGDVIKDPELFITTLDNFLAALGTRLTVPKLGGMEMNLHSFYCQVTARGGLEQVIRAAQWKELVEVLGVPKHLLNASFVLRKIYINLLFHYEQVYYLRVEGQLRLPPVPLPAACAIDQTGDEVSPYEVPLEMRASLKKRKRKLDPLQVFGVDPAASVGSTATGVINGKFEEGYFVTVVVGTEKLCGVLYHVSSGNKAHQYANVPSLVDSIGSEGHMPGMEIQLYGCSKKRKEYVRKVNPNAPKRTRTAYNIYFKEQRAKLKELFPETKGLGKKVIEMWNKLSEEEKAPYIARGSQEREKYLAEHQEKIRLQQSQTPEGANDGVAEQDVGEHDDMAYDGSHDYHVSLDVDSDPHGGQPQVSEVDQVYQVYHVNGPVLDSDVSGGHLVSEQAYEAQEDEGDYPQEPVSEEDEDVDDAELQEAYEDDEDEQVYPGSENIFEAQDGSEYQVSDKECNVPEDAYEVHANEVSAHEPHGYSGSTTPKEEYYAPTLPQQPAEVPHGSVHMAPFEQVPYQMLDNGRVLYPHLPQGHLEASGENPMPQQHYFSPNRYAFPQARQQGQVGEALGLPVPQEQGSFHKQDEGSAYLPPFQPSQAMGSNIHARKVPSELAYQDRYAYRVPMPYSQMYTHPPHAYHMRFPHPPYPMQMNEGAALQYAHMYAAQVHQPQAAVPEVARVGAPSTVYQAEDGGHAPHSQDGNLTPMVKHNTH